MCNRDSELMAAYVTGDQRAFDELFHTYSPLLARFFARHGKRPSDAQDLVQETFLHVHRARHDFRTGVPLRPWIFTIARNLCHDHGRRQLRRPEAFIELESCRAPDGSPDLAVAERAQALGRALDRLPDGDRHLLDEHWFSDRSFTELAARDGVNSTTLRVRAHRACMRLRELISIQYSAVA